MGLKGGCGSQSGARATEKILGHLPTAQTTWVLGKALCSTTQWEALRVEKNTGSNFKSLPGTDTFTEDSLINAPHSTAAGNQASLRTGLLDRGSPSEHILLPASLKVRTLRRGRKLKDSGQARGETERKLFQSGREGPREPQSTAQQM